MNDNIFDPALVRSKCWGKQRQIMPNPVLVFRRSNDALLSPIDFVLNVENETRQEEHLLSPSLM